MSDLEEYLLVVDDPKYIKEFYDMRSAEARAIDYVLIIEQFQNLLGVYTTTEALAKVAVLMREETEAEEFIRKVRDGLFHYPNHPDEPCSCNEKAAAEFMSGLTPRAADGAYCTCENSNFFVSDLGLTCWSCKKPRR